MPSRATTQIAREIQKPNARGYDLITIYDD